MLKRMSGSFVQWCDHVLESDQFVLLDTETTGLKSHDQVVEIAIIGTSCEVLYHGLIKPSCPIGEGAAAVHRITEEIVAQAPSFAEQWLEIERAIGGRKIITWNAAFDARMLVQTARAHKIILKGIDFYCAMKEYTDHYHFQRWVRLTEACSQQGIEFEQDHRALGDVCAMLEVIRAIAKKAEQNRAL
jgi:DNA polymerase-3 subunit epsilon